MRAVTFSFLCSELFEKYGTLIERDAALIEKVSPRREQQEQQEREVAKKAREAPTRQVRAVAFSRFFCAITIREIRDF
eukprot:SAG31_NODE_1819_length_7201_cov_9.661504_2_plen_78_part_00